MGCDDGGLAFQSTTLAPAQEEAGIAVTTATAHRGFSLPPRHQARRSTPPHLHRLLGRNGVGRLVDEVCRVQPDDVHTQDLARVLAVHHLGQALALLLRQRLQVGRRREWRGWCEMLLTILS